MASPPAIQLVIIDVMLAVGDPRQSRFDIQRTDEYLETGLRLLEDLCSDNPLVFPQRAVLLTNTSNATTFREAKLTSTRLGVPFWQKSTIYSPVNFGDRVAQRLAELDRC